MIRAEKNKLKRKMKWNFIGGLTLIGIIAIYLILIPILDVKNDEISLFVSLSLIFIVILIVIIFFLFGWSSQQENKLLYYKYNLERKRNRLHTLQFWNKISEGKYDEAKEMFEDETLIPYNTDLRFICLGILLGMMQQNDKLATKWDANPMEKMNKILATD